MATYTEEDWYGWIDPNYQEEHHVQRPSCCRWWACTRPCIRRSLATRNRGLSRFAIAPVEYGQGPPVEMKVRLHNRLTNGDLRQSVCRRITYRGIECERNAVYAECNQHPILGLMSHDLEARHGACQVEVRTRVQAGNAKA